MYVVISGSMKPTFDAGSLVFVREVDPRSIAVGDIITFKGADGGPILTTHRVVKINDGEQLSFITRGDANNVNDPNPVPAENVVGRVRAYIPYLGYLITFSQTKMGLVFMIFVPGGILIAYELYNIYTYTGKRKGRREANRW
jgi:signal peptidase